MSVPVYAAYKTSGAEWLGDVPAHWDAARLLNVLATPVTDGPHSTPVFTDEGRPFLSVDGIQDGELSFEGCRYISEEDFTEFTKKSAPQIDDILMGKAASIGKIARVKVSFPFSIWSPLALIRIDNDLACPKYIEFVLKSPELQASIDIRCNANTQKNIGMGDIQVLPIPLPPRSEQAAIAAFLDRETAKIDELVEEQRLLIELLKEKRQAVISHAVTKGLDPNAPIKDSGVEWLGDVPAHWEVAPLKWLTPAERAIMYGIVLPGPDVGKGIPIVKGGDVKPGRLSLDQLCWTTPEIEAPFARARLRPNDIVYSIRGSIGDAELVPEALNDANITQDVARISPIDGVNFCWLLNVMRSQPIFVQLEQRSLGAAVRGINIFDLKRAQIPVPPRSEQDSIASFLDEQLLKLSNLREEAETATKLLQERRAALISAAVTGKIDVCGLVTTSDTQAAA